VRRERGEQGAGTVLALAFLGLLVVVATAVAGVVGLVGAHRVAQGAADLAALGGASTLQDGGDACASAGLVAARNGARLRSCSVRGWQVAVTVSAPGPRLLGSIVQLPARARAGPVSSMPP
jgi:secretion/DNA translocation related TadE-like protein